MRSGTSSTTIPGQLALDRAAGRRFAVERAQAAGQCKRKHQRNPKGADGTEQLRRRH